MKNKVLIVFKYPRAHWNIPIVSKFSNFYDTEYVYLSDYKDKNFRQIISDINNLVKSANIDIVVFDVDYFKFINLFFIKKINSKKKILITGDDFELHEMNSITASGCDLVVSACPLSVLRYKEKGYEAHYIHYDNGKINTNIESKKEIDVLFFGVITPDRKEILDYIVKENILLKNVGHEENSHTLLEENELLKLISKSKIVVNFSKSRTTSVKNFSSENVYKHYYQFKGRVVLAGLNGAVCVSEYSPGQELFFDEDEILTFYTKEECVKILKNLLANDVLLEKYRKKFTTKVCSKFEEKNNFEPIYNAIEKSNHKRMKLIKIPYWYLRISAKQIILRNLKLSTLITAIFQLNEIFIITKNSNLMIKFLILFESIINTLWYSCISIFKFNKKI